MIKFVSLFCSNKLLEKVKRILACILGHAMTRDKYFHLEGTLAISRCNQRSATEFEIEENLV